MIESFYHYCTMSAPHKGRAPSLDALLFGCSLPALLVQPMGECSISASRMVPTVSFQYCGSHHTVCSAVFVVRQWNMLIDIPTRLHIA